MEEPYTSILGVLHDLEAKQLTVDEAMKEIKVLLYSDKKFKEEKLEKELLNLIPEESESLKYLNPEVKEFAKQLREHINSKIK